MTWIRLQLYTYFMIGTKQKQIDHLKVNAIKTNYCCFQSERKTFFQGQ